MGHAAGILGVSACCDGRGVGGSRGAGGNGTSRGAGGNETGGGADDRGTDGKRSRALAHPRPERVSSSRLRHFRTFGKAAREEMRFS